MKTYLYKISRIHIAHKQIQVLLEFTQNIKVILLSVEKPTGNQTILVLISAEHALIMDKNRKAIISYLRQVHRFLHNGVPWLLWLSDVLHEYCHFNP